MAAPSLSPKRAAERMRQHRHAVIVLARQSAKKAIKAQIRAQGDTHVKLNLKLRNNADWRQPFMLPTTDLTRAELRMRLGTIDLSTSNGRIVIDDPTIGAFSFVVPAADLSTVQPGHYRVELLVFQPGNIKAVFTGSIDVAGETTPAQ